ncbi:MAG: peptide ABC transporter substrate-binding protein [Clostridiales bacterium]|jgi:peptide/nickel transport system substrate-binding protein|nr:peptide ABC transporter substrate-binding protein [Clostridiales bacterium]
MKKRLLILAAALLVLSACARTAENAPLPAAAPAAEADTETPPPPAPGGEISLSMRRPATLNPVLNEDASVDKILLLVFEPLFNVGQDFSLSPALAESVETAPDGLSAVVSLRAARWHDGEPVTAADFIFTVNALKAAPDGAVYKPCVQNIDGCSALSDNQVEVRFAKNFSGNKYSFVFPLIPEHYYKGAKAGSEADMKPVGSGPYKFASFDQELSLAAREDDWRPYISAVKVIITPDLETDLYSFDQGVTDALPADMSVWGKYRGAKEARENPVNTTYFDFIGFNCAGAFKEAELRRAAAMCVNRLEYVNSVYLGYADLAAAPVHPASWAYSPDLPELPFDTAAAGEVFSKHAENGAKLSVRVLTNEENPERVKIAETLKENLGKAGAEATIETLPFEDYKAKINSGNYDIFVGGLNLSPFPDLTFALHSSGNFFRYSDEETDAALQDAFYALNEGELRAALSKVQKRCAEDLPLYGLCFRKQALLLDKKIYGYNTSYINNPYGDLKNWYIAQKQ